MTVDNTLKLNTYIQIDASTLTLPTKNATNNILQKKYLPKV